MSGLNRPWDLSPDPLAALREGNREPFEDFALSHAGLFLGFFRRLGAGLEQAEDMTQEVFLKLHQHALRYRPEERFKSYCFRVARNVWIDAQRRRAVRPRTVPIEPPAGEDEGGSDGWAPVDAQAGPDRAAQEREEAERVRRVSRELAEHHRMVFELGVVQELPYAEISSILDIPTGTVKSRMFHALRRIREALDPEEREA